MITNTGAAPNSDRGPTQHIVKCWAHQFDDVASGIKRAEFRRNDRDYRQGDTLVLQRFDPVAFRLTGQQLTFGITHVLESEFGMPAGYCMLSLSDVVQAETTLPQSAMPAWPDVVRERRRQIGEEGWTPAHDDEHANGDMALAAACYAASAGGVPWSDDVPSFWPWADQWWKPTTSRRDLVKAGALILAEIERIDRAALASSAGDQE